LVTVIGRIMSRILCEIDYATGRNLSGYLVGAGTAEKNK